MTQPTDFTTRPADLHTLPTHIAVIMDGNGRWASRRGLPRMAGHRQGARTLKDLVRCCKDWDIPILTVYAFSTENWQRPAAEVGFLLRLFDRLLGEELRSLQAAGVRLHFLGERETLPAALQTRMASAEAATAAHHTVTLNVALNYGGRQELVRSCQTLAAQVAAGTLAPADITAERLEQALSTGNTPAPDLLIRTSGEQRLSNYLLWQLAYSELYFTEVLWPDFDRAAFHQALLAYQGRQRRYGGLGDRGNTPTPGTAA